MNKCKIVKTDSKLKLAHGFDERRGLDVTHCASELECAERGGYDEKHSDGSRLNNIYLDNADVWLFTRIIYRDFGNAFHPILD
jgi:hypothetical protein